MLFGFSDQRRWILDQQILEKKLHFLNEDVIVFKPGFYFQEKLSKFWKENYRFLWLRDQDLYQNRIVR